MPIARVQMSDGRIARLEVPEGTAPAAIEAFASQISQKLPPKDRQGRDSQGNFNPDLALLDRQMTGTQPGIPASEAPTPARFPLMSGDFSLSGPLKTAFNGVSSYLDRTMTPAVVGATVGSLMFPPAAVAPNMSALARFAPNVIAAMTGGGIGGGAEEAHRPGSTPTSIAIQGAKDAAGQGAAQVAGLGVGALANKLLAPGLPIAVPAEKREAIKGIFEDALNTTKEGAQSVYNALPDPIKGPIDSLINSEGGQGAIALAHKLGALAEKTPELLRDIPGEYLAEKIKWPLLTSILGAKITVPLYFADQALNPSGLIKYLSNTELPKAAVRTTAREAATIPIRSWFSGSKDENKDQGSEP